jgi:H+/Cl- antiporter ClcA
MQYGRLEDWSTLLVTRCGYFQDDSNRRDLRITGMSTYLLTKFEVNKRSHVCFASCPITHDSFPSMSQLPTDIFMPAMGIGATVGRAVGIIVEVIVEEYADTSLVARVQFFLLLAPTSGTH